LSRENPNFNFVISAFTIVTQMMSDAKKGAGTPAPLESAKSFLFLGFKKSFCIIRSLPHTDDIRPTQQAIYLMKTSHYFPVK
jgi:hypothetical protein